MMSISDIVYVNIYIIIVDKENKLNSYFNNYLMNKL